MPKHSILQVIPQLDTGGAELSTLEMVDAIVSAGARALVATEGGRMAGEVEKLGGELLLFPAASKNPLTMLRNARWLTDLCRKERVSLLHARSRAPAWSALLAARRAKIPFVTTYHGAYNEGDPVKRFYNSVMARGDRVIANSRYTADLVMQRHKPDPDLLTVVYRGVNVEKFDRKAIDPSRLRALRRQWAVEGERRLVLQAARLTGWKGQLVVIEAAGRLLRDPGGERMPLFILAGDHQGRDDYRAQLEQRIAALGLQGHVRLVGHCSDIAAAYALAHVAVIASIEPEAFGRTSAEAQAMGCPVIATNIGAPPETVRGEPVVAAGEITGWLIPPEQPDALAVAISAALAMSEQERQALAERARCNVLENYTDHQLKLKTLGVYDALLGGRLAAGFEASRPFPAPRTAA